MVEMGGLPAQRRRVTAGLDAMLHLSKPGAIFGTDLADVGAQGTDAVVELAFVGKEIGGRRADGGTIEHQADVLRPDVIAPQFETVRHYHGEAGLMALGKRIHARVHLAAETVGNFRHRK